jgi:uncharacterized protein (DUF2236 family)
MVASSQPNAPISRDDVSEQLNILMAQHDPKVGLFGPDSLFWEVNRHSIVYFLGGLQSVQMQLCHPWVASAILEHSLVMTNRRRRSQLTYTFLWSIIYGDIARVRQRAQALYAVHTRVEGVLDSGQHYQANEANAMLWVHVTAFSCRVKLYERLVKKLSRDQKDQFVKEAQRYAACFGISSTIHPQSWQEVEDYLLAVEKSDVLKRTDAGLQIRHLLESGLPQRIRKPLWRFLCSMLPVSLAEMLDQPTRSGPLTPWVLKIVGKVLPSSIRYVPAWHEAMARINGKTTTPKMVTRMNQAIIGKPTLVL